MTTAGEQRDHDDDRPRSSRGPLAGIRILELATVIMAPYAVQLLGDLGAEVVKVEGGKGDGSRVMGGGPHAELSGIALNLHRNKRSISLDLKADRGREVFLRLLDRSDVLITNLRPRPLERLGLSYEQVARTRPGLVYCQAQGFASSDRDADRPAYDDIIQAVTGMPALNERVLGTTAFFPSLIADKVAGLIIAYAVLGALVHRQGTSEGQHVEVPMFDAVLAFNLVEHLGRAVTPGEPAGYSRVMTSNRGPHRTKNGHIALMPYTDEHWHALFTAVGREDILQRPWFREHRLRLDHADRVYGDLAEVIAERTTEEWLDLCSQHQIPASPVPALDDIVNDRLLNHGMLSELTHPTVGLYRSINPPARFSATPASVRRPAPLVAQHTEEILAEAGYSSSEIADLVDGGVARIRAPKESPS
jgi:crotonobetainyl-CoA:carnitine CoA-transferase CaiB-like acyl-CoA transferase